MTRKEELTGKGWQKQSTNDEPRLSELADMYQEIGYQVHLEPFHPEEEPGCTECMKLQADRYKTIYIRKKTSEDSDIFE
ncbi:MAG: hypothetical protein JSU83_02880 [Deltaproteobacteria bacterium]|nr:MAG: hypothetical protein JSU83_02880 [Deltaproteobacteria bacterium]